MSVIDRRCAIGRYAAAANQVFLDVPESQFTFQITFPGGGFWGDDPTAAKRQVEGGPIDYLVMDYLAERKCAFMTASEYHRTLGKP